MKPAKQFWALLKFQISLNPFLWLLLLPLFSVCVFTHFFTPFGHSTGVAAFFIVLYVGFIGLFIIAPEKLAVETSGFGYTAGRDFLLTLAIDRGILYRARASLFYLLISVLPVVLLIASFEMPDLVVKGYSPDLESAIKFLPGTRVLETHHDLPSAILIPGGNILKSEWNLCIFLCAAILMQFLISNLYGVKSRIASIFIIYFLLVFLSFIIRDSFFIFAAHPVSWMAVTAIAFIITQLWCEWFFTQDEISS